MNKLITVFVALLCCIHATAWSPKENTIKTRWTDKVTPENVWQSYPRPQLERSGWLNLNGLWDYAITPDGTGKDEVEFEGEILVPFCAESALSGVKRPVKPTDVLWYSRDFELPEYMKGKRVILHFGAVDYRCNIWINGKEAGSHVGGNNPFSVDITDCLKKKGAQKIELRVTDPTDTESISRGKQQLNQGGIWYTPVSGIWKTVWVEAVNNEHMTSVYADTDIYTGKVRFDIANTAKKGCILNVEVKEKGGKVLASASVPAGESPELTVPGFRLWTPKTPQLYDVKITLMRGNKVLDEVKSYFAFRKTGIKEDEMGYRRFCLNDEIIFQYGTLDQGWWPDGLLTPPSEEAMLWDMVELKKMGFNTIRKHIKVEPELYYYYADSLGIMIWQDMVSGFATSRKKEEHVASDAKFDWNAPQEHTEQWQKELFNMIDILKFYPCITTWVVFNEGWGQHNTAEIVNKVMDYDKTRIIDGVSGWTDRKVGHLHDIHNYPVTSMILPENNNGRVSVLGEFGGYGWSIQGHLWNPNMRNWGYRNIDGGLDLIANYSRMIYDLEALIAQGLSGAIYTQTTDVEGEVNGLITYDREVTKVPSDMMHILHSRLYKAKGAKVTTLIKDGQDGSKNTRALSYDGKTENVAFPTTVKGKGSYTASCTFDADQEYDNLSLWLFTPGKVKVWLNGTMVLDQESRQKRHYNHFNISDWSQCLVKGSNELTVEVQVANENPFMLDFGLRAY